MPAPQPIMLVVGGPSGSGKSRMFPVAESGYAAFNVDDRCRDLNGGSYVATPPAIRAQAQRECEQFVMAQITSRTSFAVETTLRSPAAIQQAAQAKAAGFLTQLVYVSTGNVEINVERVALRALDGGHGAPPDRIRDIYAKSLGHLPVAIATFDLVVVYDSSEHAPRGPSFVCEFRRGRQTNDGVALPPWLRQAIGR